nr:hypothetical protein [Haloarcula sp. CBA1127]
MSTTEEWDAAGVRDLHDDLVSLHGPVERTSDHGADASADPGEGVRQLVTTILSQNVADENTRRASEALFTAYSDFEAIEAADHDELADTIRVAGLPDQKPPAFSGRLRPSARKPVGPILLPSLTPCQPTRRKAGSPISRASAQRPPASS